MRLKYNGPHDGVEVPLPDGREIVVERGGEGDFPDEVAKSLLEQESNWEPAAKARPAKKEE